jgi:hypothetical protein
VEKLNPIRMSVVVNTVVMSQPSELDKIIDASISITSSDKVFDKQLLKTQQIYTLSQWRQVSDSDKSVYPQGLKIILNNAAGIQQVSMLQFRQKEHSENGENGDFQFDLLGFLYLFMEYVHGDGNRLQGYDLVPSRDIDDDRASPIRISSDVDDSQQHSLRRRLKK